MQNITLDKLEEVIKVAMPRITKAAGAEVVSFANKNFRMQGFQGKSFKPWQQRKGASNSKGRAILIQSGRLRRSIRVLRVTNDSVVVGTDVPYARAHNNGFRGTVSVRGHQRNRYGKKKVGTGTYSTKTRRERQRTVTQVTGSGYVKPHTRTMRLPRRQFIGRSPVLENNVRRVIAAEILKALKK